MKSKSFTTYRVTLQLKLGSRSNGEGAGIYMYDYDVVVKKFTFVISSPDEFLLAIAKLRSMY